MRDTRASLLSEAEILVRGRGYSGFSYADLAEAVGIRKASIHHHFRTKEALAQALIEAYDARYDAALDDISGQTADGVARIEAYGRLYLGGVERGLGCLCAALAVELPKYARPHKEQWREAVHCAVAGAAPRDGFVAVTFPGLFEHYFRREGRPGALASVPNTGEALTRYARKLQASGARTLFILEAREPGLSAATEELLRKSTRGEEKTAFKDATVYAFRL